MIPLTLSACLAAVIGAAVACAMCRRVRQVAAEAATLRAELLTERHAARHDALTGLLNRREFLRCSTSWAADPNRYPLIAVVLDLDNFKQINDELGHAVGDEVLTTVAARFSAQPGNKLVARFGGDEFVGLVSRPACNESPPFTVAGLVAAVALPMRVFGHDLQVTASVGAHAVRHRDDLLEAIRGADAAMYRSKAGHMVSWPPMRRADRATRPAIDDDLSTGAWLTRHHEPAPGTGAADSYPYRPASGPTPVGKHAAAKPGYGKAAARTAAGRLLRGRSLGELSG
jgi:diguanylate cyclase (GGDEF)-like protein